jgi:hypothetical protein
VDTFRKRPQMIGKDLYLVVASYFAVSVGQHIWRATFQNLAIDTFDITPVQIGLAYSIVSIPGFLSAILGLIAVRIRLFRLLFSSFLLIGIGLIGIGILAKVSLSFGSIDLAPLKAVNTNTVGTVNTRFVLLSVCLLILHSGLVAYYPTINTIFLLGVKSKDAFKKLSILKSIGPLAGALGTGVVLLLLTNFSYAVKLSVVGLAVILVGTLCVVMLPSRQYEGKQRMVRLKKALAPYYLLNFLNGCRSAIFKTFVIYYLITEFHFELKTTAAIVLVGNIFTFAGYQLISRLVQKYDPAKLLSLLYIVMCLNFLGFMWTKDVRVLSIIYLIDSLVFCTSAITDGYLKFLSRGKELLGDLAVGVSLFHLGGVMMSFIGGLLYSRNDIRVFLLGSACALAAFFVAGKLAERVSD